MTIQQAIRLRIIRIVRDHAATDSRLTRARLVNRFGPSYRERANSEIGKLLSDGVLISTGTGHRGDPSTLHIGPVFSKDKCPMCLQECS